MEAPVPGSSPWRDKPMIEEPTVLNGTAKGAEQVLGLRQRAEAQFSTSQPQTEAQLSPEETSKVLHELQVHQIELEMQNEELRRTQAEAAVQELSAQLERRVSDRTRELSTLYAIATVTSQCLALGAMLERALVIVLETLEGHSATIQLIDETDHSLRLNTQVNLPTEAAVDRRVLSRRRSLGSWVVEHDAPLVVPDVSLDSRRVVKDQAEKLWKARTYAGVPMHVQGRCVGVLAVLRPAARPFNPEAVSLLSTIADQLAAAIEAAQLRQQGEQAAVREERQRLARELHDSLIQALYSLTLLAETGYRQLVAGDQALALEQLALVRDTAHQALKEMRLLVYELRPAALDSEGLVGALQQRLEAVEQRAGTETQLQVEGPGDIRALGQLSFPLEEALYRIALEALNNAYRHAKVTRITVRLAMDTRQIELEITDNGQGFDPEALAGHGGQGLTNMRERAEKLSGKFDLVSAPGQGTRVLARFELTRLGQAGQEAA
jgi:signal transduction histidine kinase